MEESVIDGQAFDRIIGAQFMFWLAALCIIEFTRLNNADTFLPPSNVFFFPRQMRQVWPRVDNSVPSLKSTERPLLDMCSCIHGAAMKMHEHVVCPWVGMQMLCKVLSPLVVQQLR